MAETVRGGTKRRAQDQLQDTSRNTDVSSAFSQFERTLTQKYDKHEAIVKISRDITVQSKRVIFLLQRYNFGGDNEALLLEAAAKFQPIADLFQRVTELLGNEPQEKYFRAVSPGTQEFIEAVSFYWVLKNGTVPTPDDVQPMLTFFTKSFVVPATDFMAGLADLTGELMRCCINHIGNAQVSTHFCTLIRNIYAGMSKIPSEQLGREITEKMVVMKTSLQKVEDACYTACLRRAEFPNATINEEVINLMTSTAADNNNEQ